MAEPQKRSFFARWGVLLLVILLSVGAGGYYLADRYLPGGVDLPKIPGLTGLNPAVSIPVEGGTGRWGSRSRPKR